MNVNIFLYDDFETIDAFGPVEVFGKLSDSFHIRYLSVSGDVVNSVHGAKIWTDFLVPEEIDGILVVPGGKGARRLLWKDERSLTLLKRSAQAAQLCLMVGNGSALMARTGLLYRRRIADFPMDENWNRNFTAGIERIRQARIVADGKYYSCGSSFAGIDLSLWAIADILDVSDAEKAAGEMGLEWNGSEDEGIYC